MQPLTQENFNQLFADAYEKPAMQQFQQQTVPGITNAFAGEDARESSALNEAIAQAGKDMSTTIAGQKANFMQNQQEMQYGLLGQLLNMMQQPEFQPYLQQEQGWLPMILNAAAQAGGGYAGGRF